VGGDKLGIEGGQGPEGSRASYVDAWMDEWMDGWMDGWILYSNTISLRFPLNGKDTASPSLIFT